MQSTTFGAHIEHIDNGLEHAIYATNMMHLLDDEVYKAYVDHLISSSSVFGRDGNDARGKQPLCQIAKKIGIPASQLVVDPAQAGGLMGRSDGAIIGPQGRKEPIEIKGFRCKKGKRSTVYINDIRLNDTDWQHLFIVSRQKDPVRWTDVREYRECGFNLAYVKRRDLNRAVWASGRGLLTKVDATITPGSKRGWLGRYVRWVKVQDISRKWWDKHVLH